jgi:hypothetical protein
LRQGGGYTYTDSIYTSLLSGAGGYLGQVPLAGTGSGGSGSPVYWQHRPDGSIAREIAPSGTVLWNFQHGLDQWGNPLDGPTTNPVYPPNSALVGNGAWRDPFSGMVSSPSSGLGDVYSPDMGGGLDEDIPDSAMAYYGPSLRWFGSTMNEGLNQAASFHPAYNAYTALTGKNASGDCVSAWERISAGLGMIPGGAVKGTAVTATQHLRINLAKNGGMLGKLTTRYLDWRIAKELIKEDWEIVGGGLMRKQEAIKPADWVSTGKRGRPKNLTLVDITAKKNGKILRIQTVDTLPNGMPTEREEKALDRIRKSFPNDLVIWFPKNVKWEGAF